MDHYEWNDDEWSKQLITAGNGEEEDETNLSSSLGKKDEQMLPHAGVGRIMRRALLPNAKIAVDAKQAVQEYATEFVAYVTYEAAQRCKMEKHKTITGDDIVRTLASLGFENYVEPLKAYLRRYSETHGDAADVDPNQGPAGGKDGAEPSTSRQTTEKEGGAGNEMDWRRVDENWW